MDVLEQTSTIYIVAGILGSYSLVLTLVITYLAMKLRQYTRRYERLVEGVEATNIESLITDHLQKSKQLEESQRGHAKKIKTLEEWSKMPYQKLGFLRYNPFDDFGSDQSFSVAILDNNDSGFMLTSLRSREGTQIYAKQIKGGEAPSHQLSEEEQKVLEQALGNNIHSPKQE